LTEWRAGNDLIILLTDDAIALTGYCQRRELYVLVAYRRRRKYQWRGRGGEKLSWFPLLAFSRMHELK